MLYVPLWLFYRLSMNSRGSRYRRSLPDVFQCPHRVVLQPCDVPTGGIWREKLLGWNLLFTMKKITILLKKIKKYFTKFCSRKALIFIKIYVNLDLKHMLLLHLYTSFFYVFFLFSCWQSGGEILLPCVQYSIIHFTASTSFCVNLSLLVQHRLVNTWPQSYFLWCTTVCLSTAIIASPASDPDPYDP